MRITIGICDHCDTDLAKCASFDSYSVDNGPTIDICRNCQEKPFRSAQPSARGLAVLQTVRLALNISQLDDTRHLGKPRGRPTKVAP